MGLRTKLLLPTVFVYVLFALIVHFFWAPTMQKHVEDKALEHVGEILQSIEPSITRFILSGDLAALYSLLDRNREINKDVWKTIVLYDAKGKRLYPLIQPEENTNINTISLERTFLWGGRPAGSVSLILDLSSEVAKEFEFIYQLEWMVLTLFGLFTVIGLLWLNVTFRRPLSALEYAARQLVKGDFKTELPPPGKDELGHLIQAFDTMRTSLQNTQGELQAALQNALHSELLQKTVLENVDAGIMTINEDGVIENINTAAESIFGYGADLVKGKNIKTLIPDCWVESEDGSILWCGLDKSVEITGRRNGGNFFPIELSLSGIYLDDRHIYTGIVLDITERKQWEAAIINTKEIAEKANKAKSVFLSRMSHELRTPLNAILGFGQLLELDLDDPESSEHLVKVKEILNAGNHLLELINEVLDLAKIEAGKLEISMESISLNNMVNECMVLLTPLAKKRGIELKDDLSVCIDQSVYADFTRLKQVMLNLMSNAIKYNKREGSVIVHCDMVAPGRLRITVEDTGLGLSESQRKLLFQPFERLSAKSDIEGTGIGLVVSKHLVEAMSGTIGVDSEVGKGCRFWIELGVRESIELIATNDFDEDENEVPCDNHEGSQKKLLYIEDNPANTRLVEQLLEKRSNIELVCAKDAISGIELAQTLIPDLILLDINLPDMDGFEALHQLSKIEQTYKIPVVAVSANAMTEDLEKGIKAGFTAYITKPINISHFYQVIDEIFDEMAEQEKRAFI